MANTLEVSLALKSSGFRNEINNIKKDNKILKAEFEKLSSEVDNFEDTLEGKQARLKLVSKEYENAKKMVEIYKRELENSKKVLEKANQEFKDQEEAINQAKAQLKDYSEAFGDNSDVVKRLQEDLNKLEKEHERQAKAVASANTQYQNMILEVSRAETEVNNLGREINNCSSDIDNFDSRIENLENELEEVNRELDNVGDSALDFSAKMSEVGQGLINISENLGELGRKGLSVIGELVSSGAEWSAQVSGTQFIYDNLDKTIQNIIDTGSREAKAIGLTAQQYKDSATAIANYYKNMGLTTDETSKLVGETMNLVADLGAITDMPFDEAMSRFKSGLMGNYEALDGFGINVSASTLENSKFVESLGKSWKDLSDNEKMLATYNEIMRQSSSAKGLATQEAENFGMRLKLLKQEVKEASGQIGENLLPTLEPLISMFSNIVSKIVDWSKNNPKLVTGILTVVGVISSLMVVLAPVLSMLGNATILFGALSSTAVASGTSILGVIGSALVPFITTLGIIIAVATTLVMAIKENWEGIKQATNELIETCRPYFENLKESFKTLWATCQDIYNTVIQPLFKIIGEIIEECIRFVTPILSGLMTHFSIIFDTISIVWNTVGKPIFNLLMSTVKAVWELFRPIFNNISSLFNSVMAAISSLWNSVGKPVFSGIMSIIGKLIEYITPAFNTFKNVIKGAMDFVLTPINMVINAIKSLADWVSSVGKKVGNFVSNLNPFKNFNSRNIDINYSVDNANFEPKDYFKNVALSGSYYTPKNNNFNGIINRATNDINRITSKGVSINNSLDTGRLEELMLNMINILSVQNNLIKNSDRSINIDGREIARAVAPYSSEIDKYNLRNARYL